jgi:protein-disulfide isomerase
MKIIPIIFSLAILTSCTAPLEQNTTVPSVTEPTINELLVPSEIFSAMTLTGSSMYRYLASDVLEIGSTTAPNTLTVFTNYACAYCNEFFTEQYPAIANKFIDTNEFNLKIVPKIVQKYDSSVLVSSALHCAGIQNKGYEYHSGLLELKTFTNATLGTLASTLELNTESFGVCINSEDTRKSIERQQSVINRINVPLIPTFYIGSESIIGLPTPIDLEGFMQLHTKPSL